MPLTTRLKKLIAESLIGIVLAFPGCASIDKPVAKIEYSPAVADIKCKEARIYPPNYQNGAENLGLTKERDLEGFISAGFGTDYIDRRDFISDKGAVNEYFFTFSKKNNFLAGDVISAGFLADYSLKEGKTVETDFFARYSFSVNFPEKLVGGYIKESYGDRISLGFEHWNYNSEARDNENVLTLGFFHNSRVDLDFKHYIPFEKAESGLISFNVSKKLALGDFYETGFYLIPNANIRYAYNWQGLNGFPGAAPGISVSVERKRLILTGSLRHQVPLISEIKDRDYASLELGFRF